MSSLTEIIKKNQTLAVYALGLLIIACAGFTVLFLNHRDWKEMDKDFESWFSEGTSTSTISSKLTSEDQMEMTLNENFLYCLKEHTSKFQEYFSSLGDETPFNITNEIEKNVRNEILYVNQRSVNPKFLPLEVYLHYFIIDFSKVMRSLDVQFQLIEPSVLFCLLPTARKYNLITRGYRVNKMQGLSNVVTFGITEKEAEILDKTASRKKLIDEGFRIWRYPKIAGFKTKSGLEKEMLQFIIKKNHIRIHVIVFYLRETYLMHPGLNAIGLNTRGLLFLEDGAYDNYSISTLNLDTNIPPHAIHVPSDPRFFLLNMETSKFLECKNTTDMMSEIKDSQKRQVIEALKEIKARLGWQMVNFWLWGKTLLGWYENCNVLQYSIDLELSLALKSVEGYNFTGLFGNSTCQAVKQDFSLNLDTNIEMECQNINVKISLMHEEKNMTWYAYQNQEHTYRQTYPVYEVCSTDVWGLKINVPCNTNKIIEMMKKQDL